MRKSGRTWKSQEIEVQNRISDEYESKRYRLEHSRC